MNKNHLAYFCRKGKRKLPGHSEEQTEDVNTSKRKKRGKEMEPHLNRNGVFSITSCTER